MNTHFYGGLRSAIVCPPAGGAEARAAGRLTRARFTFALTFFPARLFVTFLFLACPAASLRAQAPAGGKPVSTNAALGAPAGQRPLQPPASAPANANDLGAIQVSGSLSSATVAKGDHLRFFVTVRNQTTAPIFNIELNGPTAEGLDVALRCWCGSASGVCSDLTASSAAPNSTSKSASDASAGPSAPCSSVIASQLAPGQSVAVWGDLYAAKAEDKETIVGEVDWKDGTGADAKASSYVFALGEAVVQSGFEQFRSSSFYDFLKDISLPVVLALLAAGLAWYDKWREGKRSEAAEERAHTLQTWDRMLPISHNLATRYYMPIEGATRAALGALDQRQEALKAAGDPKASAQMKTDRTQEAADKEAEVFFYLLLMRCRLRILFDERGGWYFKDRVGEELSNQCLNDHYDLCLDKPVEVRTAMSIATGKITANEKLGAFLQRMGGSDADALEFQKLLGYFRDFLKSDDCEPAFDNLRVWRLMLSYEMNRPYQYWYGSQEKLCLDTKKMRDVILAAAKKIETTPPGSPGFEKAAEQYLDRAENPGKQGTKSIFGRWWSAFVVSLQSMDG